MAKKNKKSDSKPATAEETKGGAAVVKPTDEKDKDGLLIHAPPTTASMQSKPGMERFEDIKEGDNSRIHYLGIPELADSIRRDGLLQNLIVDVNTKELISGYRRRKAIELLREQAAERGEPLPFDDVAVMYFNGNTLDRAIVNIKENKDRNNLSTYELGTRFKFLRDTFKLSGEAISMRVGEGETKTYSKGHINNFIAVVEKLHPRIQKYLQNPQYPEPPQMTLFKWAYLKPEEQIQAFEGYKESKTGEGEGNGAAETEDKGPRMRKMKEAKELLSALEKAEPKKDFEVAIKCVEYLLTLRKTPPVKLVVSGETGSKAVQA